MRLKNAVLDPGVCIVAEADLTGVGIDPVAVQDLGFLQGEPDLSVGLVREGFRSGAVDAVRSWVTYRTSPKADFHDRG